MYYRVQDGNLVVKSQPDTEEITIPLASFGFISSICPHPNGNELFLTGVAKGNELPSLKHNSRGDVRLYRIRLGESSWECIYPKYAHDPAPIPGTEQIAFHRGNGIAVVDHSGRLVHEAKLGQFDWGAPSVSSSPNGKRVAYIKWQGDNQKICCITLSKRSFQKYKPSCYRYAWFDDDHIVYCLNSGLKLLDLESGESELFVRNLASEASKGFECQEHELADFIYSNVPKEYSYNFIRSIDDTVYFDGMVAAPPLNRGYDGLFSIRRDRLDLKLIYLSPPDTNIVGFEVDGRGNVLLETQRYERLRVVERLSIPVGPDRDFLSNGWRIFRESTSPEFGFHYLGECD